MRGERVISNGEKLGFRLLFFFLLKKKKNHSTLLALWLYSDDLFSFDDE